MFICMNLNFNAVNFYSDENTKQSTQVALSKGMFSSKTIAKNNRRLSKQWENFVFTTQLSANRLHGEGMSGFYRASPRCMQ